MVWAKLLVIIVNGLPGLGHLALGHVFTDTGRTRHSNNAKDEGRTWISTQTRVLGSTEGEIHIIAPLGSLNLSGRLAEIFF